MKRPRAFLLGLHRYVGLSLAAFLLLAGPTGSVAAFHDALDGLLNPDLFRARNTGPALPLSVLADRLKQQVPDGRLGYLVYRPAPGESVRAYLQPEPGRTLAQDEIFADPATGDVLGKRSTTGCCLNRRDLIPFLYRFHYSLALGRTGILVMGVVSLIWAIDCVTGLLLTFPVRWVPWRWEGWRRWSLAWRIEPNKGGIRRLFDLHRALSLWLWIVLLGIAISGVSLNLQEEVFRPVVSALLPIGKPHRGHHRLPAQAGTHVGLDDADRIATQAARAEGWTGLPGAVFAIGDSYNFYFGDSGGHRAAGLGGPVVTVDAATGMVSRVAMPGHGKAGDVVLDLQFPWHCGAIAGLAGRIVVAISGVVVPILVVTGILIWHRKRHPRKRRRAPGSRVATREREMETVRPS